MIALYHLLRGIPTDTSDPQTKERYGLPLVLHVVGEVLSTVVLLLMGLIALDILFEDCVPSDLKEGLMEHLVQFLVVMVPSISVLITGLLYGGLLVER